MRRCLMGLRLAETLGLNDSDHREVYYLSLWSLRKVSSNRFSPLCRRIKE